MNVTSAVQTVPRVLLVGYVQAARLPLDLAARATGQAGNEQWPPAVAYETLSAKVEEPSDPSCATRCSWTAAGFVWPHSPSGAARPS